jgi:1,4-dihydroxy-2-naphthoyl-CoA hydrolase
MARGGSLGIEPPDRASKLARRMDDELTQADSLGGMLGIEYGQDGPEVATGRVAVTKRVMQPYGVVHGGAHAVIAESICSWATMNVVGEDGMVAMGQSNHATFLRPISEGHINARATVRHRGRTTWVWDCELTDDDGRLCALVRMTVAVRPAPSE